MGKLLTYSGIVTKVKSMNSKLLDDADYVKISQASNVSDIIAYLKTKESYADIFAPLGDYEMHRGDVEKLLVQSLYHDYIKLYRFGDSNVRRYLRSYIIRHEVDVIIYCFRIVFNHYAEPFDLHHKREFFDQYSCINIDRLISSTSEQELVEGLAGTDYYHVLKKLCDSGSATLADYNLALYLYNYSTLWKLRKKYVNPKEMQIITRELGNKFDLLNLRWIYRVKKHFTMSTSDIYSILIPVQFHLKLDELKTLVEAPTKEDFEKAFAETYYGKRYHYEDSLDLEQNYNKYLLHLYKADSRSNPYSLAPVNMYLYRREVEIKRITTALECTRYGITSSESLKYIGGIAQ